MSVKIYFDLMSQPARSVVMFVKANKIPFTPCPIAMRKVEHQSDAYAAINPFKKIPALQDGDFTLTESVTMSKYLHEKFDCPDHWYPRSLQKRSQVNEYLDWQHTNTRPLCAKIFLADVIFPRMTGTPPDHAALEPDVRRMEESLDQVQSYFLQDKPFICGDEISLADLFAVNEIIQLEPTGYDSLERRPKLTAWIERVRQRLGPDLYDEVTQMITKLKKAANKPKL